MKKPHGAGTGEGREGEDRRGGGEGKGGIGSRVGNEGREEKARGGGEGKGKVGVSSRPALTKHSETTT